MEKVRKLLKLTEHTYKIDHAVQQMLLMIAPTIFGTLH